MAVFDFQLFILLRYQKACYHTRFGAPSRLSTVVRCSPLYSLVVWILGLKICYVGRAGWAQERRGNITCLTALPTLLNLRRLSLLCVVVRPAVSHVGNMGGILTRAGACSSFLHICDGVLVVDWVCLFHVLYAVLVRLRGGSPGGGSFCSSTVVSLFLWFLRKRAACGVWRWSLVRTRGIRWCVCGAG